MYCPDYNILRSKYLVLTMYSDRDVPSEFVPRSQWINPLQYEAVILPKAYNQDAIHLVINKNGRFNTKLSNWLYKYVKPRLCRWFGIHQRFDCRGGKSRCHHCDIGN